MYILATVEFIIKAGLVIGAFTAALAAALYWLLPRLPPQ